MALPEGTFRRSTPEAARATVTQGTPSSAPAILRKGGPVSAMSVLASGAGSYVHWGVIQISVTNLLIVGGMIVLFVLAILLPFPGHRRRPDAEDQS